MEAQNGVYNLRKAVEDKAKHYDTRFEDLEDSLAKLVNAIATLTTSIDEFKGYWGKAIPIQLVFWIVALIVGGQTALAAIKYFIPVP